MIVLCMFSLEYPKVMIHNAAISPWRLLILSNSYSSFMNSTNTRRDLVMWLWQAHNEVCTLDHSRDILWLLCSKCFAAVVCSFQLFSTWNWFCLGGRCSCCSFSAFHSFSLLVFWNWMAKSGNHAFLSFTSLKVQFWIAVPWWRMRI